MDTRPNPTLDDILGQDRAVETLRAAVHSGRLHHAWIFAGPHGVGKFTAALAFASLLLDPTSEPDLTGAVRPDPASEIQRLIAAGTHPDLHIVRKELARYSDDANLRNRKLTNIPIDVLREHLIDKAALAPALRNDARAAKVFIVDEAELMAGPGQNALLKTLEEPPPRTVIVLVTTNEHELLPTIRSRCQRVAFTLLPPDAMAEWFERHGPDVSPAERAWIERFADGSPGRARLAADTGLYDRMSALEPMLDDADRARFDPALGPAMKKTVDAWAQDWVDEHQNASKEAANHVAAAHLFSVLADRARRRLRDAAERDDEPALRRALATLDAIADCERHVEANVNMGNAMENLAARLAGA